MMMTRGRSFIAAFMACTITLAFSAPAYPSYNSEAGHKYSIASERLADLKKSKKKKYRSYWMDCIRTLEMVEKKYPKSPSAAEACFDRAGVYEDLYRYNKRSKDLAEAAANFLSCQSSYPKNARAPEALYHVLEIALDYRKDSAAADDALDKLSKNYPDSSWTSRAKERASPSMRKSRKHKQETELRKMPVPVIAALGKTKPDSVVQKIRYWSGGDYTRIVIEQNTSVQFQAQELKHPDRLVFDLLSTRLDPSVDKEPLPVNDGILKQVRASQYAPDIVRVVLDLASIKSYVAFPLRDPHRLVIDVTGEGGKGADIRVESLDTDTQQNVQSTAGHESEQEPALAEDRQSEAKTEQTPTLAEEPKAEAKTDQTPALAEESKTEPRTEIPRITPALPKPVEANNDGNRLTLSRQMGLKIRTIAIDAGHGGHDPGAIGKSGLKEKNITLDIAKRLAVLIKGRLGCNVVMTRDRDVFIPLDQRPFIAKSHNADLFVSIHINANRKRTTRGIETYVQGLKASDREAMATAARENAMSTRSLGELDSEVDKMLKDLKIDNKIEESIQLAGVVQASLVDSVRPLESGVVNHGIKSAFFYVLMNTNIPSILAEVGFISNPAEEKLLKKDSYRQALAEALYRGVKKYIESRGPQMAGM
ncbi:MAG TPA: N-acetylmuramoyl-L-alanine amidase [Nitrospirota bacterium]|nr:N-acetylmuramoyl-L-alanine amidase [Nitrospirota bacterium]